MSRAPGVTDSAPSKADEGESSACHHESIPTTRPVSLADTLISMRTVTYNQSMRLNFCQVEPAGERTWRKKTANKAATPVTGRLRSAFEKIG